MATEEKHAVYSISLQEAKRKCSEKHSCFVRVESVEHVGLSPRYLGQLKKGVNEELTNKLMRYSDVLEGVPVSYEGFRILQRSGSILDELPFIHFDVKVNFIVFKPTIGRTLVGVVNKIGVDHVGCLVHNCFNASISKSNFRNGLIYDSLDIGSDFIFKVIEIEAVNGVLSITGEVEDHRKHSRKRKHKNQEENRTNTPERTNETHLERMNGINDLDESTHSKSTKKKRKKNKVVIDLS
ncbi:hypothetical protein ABFA07_004010 [Porites harrisoni]